MRGFAAAFVLLTLSSLAVGADPPGKPKYDKLCASCHGVDGKGDAAKAAVLKVDPSVLNLGRQETAGASRDDLKTILLDGKGKMPAFAKKLSAADADAVLDYAIQLAQTIRQGERRRRPVEGPATRPRERAVLHTREAHSAGTA